MADPKIELTTIRRMYLKLQELAAAKDPRVEVYHTYYLDLQRTVDSYVIQVPYKISYPCYRPPTFLCREETQKRVRFEFLPKEEGTAKDRAVLLRDDGHLITSWYGDQLTCIASTRVSPSDHCYFPDKNDEDRAVFAAFKMFGVDNDQ